MLKTFPSVGVVVLKDEQVLLIVKDNHPQHAYQLPGGQIEDDETPVQAAVRELEETTCLVATAELIKIPTEWRAVIKKDYGEAIFPFICFICTDYIGEMRKTDSAMPEWVALKDLNTTLLNPNTQNAIQAAMALLAAK
jgi:mutator protein MutT